MNKSIIKTMITVLLTTGLLFNHAFAQPIPGTKIFKNGETKALQLSPNTKLVLGSYRLDDGTSLILRDSAKQKSYQLIRFANGGLSRLTNFSWVDDNTVYITYNIRGIYNGNKAAFIHFDINAKAFKPKLQQIKASGYVVDFMPNVDNTLLFARDDGWKSVSERLYRVTTDQLADDNVDDAERLPGSLDGGRSYSYDRRNNRLYASTIKQTNDDKIKVLYWYRDFDAQKWSFIGEIFTDEQEFEMIGLANKDTLVVLSNDSTNLKSVVEFNLRTRTYGKVLYQHPKYDLVDARLNKGSTDIDFVQFYDHGQLVTQFFGDKDKAVEQLIAATFKDKQFEIIGQRDGHENKLVFVFDSDDPGQYYLFDSKNKQMIALGKTLTELNDYPLVKSEVFTVTNEQNQPVESYLTRPKNDSNGVLLVMPHGGPIGVRETDSFLKEVQYLVSRGYAVLRVNFRGSTGFGKDFQQGGVGQFGKAIEQDISAAVKQVKQKYNYKQMCSIGISYGGYSAMMLAMTYPEQYQCVIAMYGVYDLPHFFNAISINKEYNEQRVKAWTKVIGENTDELKKVSPFYFADKLQSPLLLVAGTKDGITWIEQSNRMKYRLQQLGKDMETQFYKGVGHSHRSWKGERHQYAYIDHFIRKKLNVPAIESQAAKEALAEDAFVIADIYDSSSYFDPDDEKALSFYQQAAAAGSAKAIDRIARFYEKGRVVEKDLQKANEMFQQASKQGYEFASYKLGKMYRLGELGPVDHEKSVKLYQLAQQQGHKHAYLDVAKAHCNGKGINKDLSLCLSQLSKKGQRQSQLEKRRHQVIAELLSETDFDGEGRRQIMSLIAKQFKIKQFDVDADLISWGTFASYGHYKTLPTVPIARGMRFGAVFKLDAPDSYEEEEQTVFLVKWTTPNVVNSKVVGKSTTANLLFTDIGKYMNVIYQLRNKWELVEADWHVEVTTLDNKPIWQQSFKTEKLVE